MPDYAYKAADSGGTIVKGVRFANNEDELAIHLKDAGLFLVEFKEARAQEIRDLLEGVQIGGVRRRDLVEFSTNMGVMVKAGVPLMTALNELREDIEIKYFKKILGQMIEDIQGGDNLHVAMSKQPKVFPELYVNVIQIGESTGGLDAAFFDLARHYKRIDDLIRNVRKAMIYPIFVIIALIVAALVFLTLVFPPLFSLLLEFNVPLPTVTKVVMAVSEVLQARWLLLLICVVALVIIFFVLRRFKTTKYYIDWCELHFPFIRGLFIQLRMAFFMRYLAMLVSGGVDILRGLELAIQSANNLVMQKYFTAARQRVIEGDLLSDALRKVRFVPNMVARMIGIGEEAGNLPEQMEYIADYYNEELERKIAVYLALMEPILIFLLAAMALALIMGVLLPLYNLVSTLSAGVGQGTASGM
jgi:type II secretory pathway component PulF